MINHSEFILAFGKGQNEIFICSRKEDPSGGPYGEPSLIRRKDLSSSNDLAILLMINI